MDAITKVQKTQQRPQLVYEETSRAVALLRDLFNPSYENIFVNDDNVFHEVKDYVALIAPEKAGIVKRYTGKVPIFDNFNVTKQIKASFGKTVNYAHGAYLIIEHTEAMHVVDVNSGNRSKNEKGQEGTALDTNLGAADELARQLRLRDMGGIIVVDILFTDQLEGKIDRLVNKIGIKKFYLHVHPYVAAYINQGIMSLKRKWQMKYGFGVHIIPSQKLAFLQYEFYDAKGEYLDMKEEIETK